MEGEDGVTTGTSSKTREGVTFMCQTKSKKRQHNIACTLFLDMLSHPVRFVQKQPANRKSGAASKAGSGRNSKPPAAAPDTTMPPGPATGQSKQDWRTAKVQKPASAVPIGKQLKVSTNRTYLFMSSLCACTHVLEGLLTCKHVCSTKLHCTKTTTTGSNHALLPADF